MTCSVLSIADTIPLVFNVGGALLTTTEKYTVPSSPTTVLRVAPTYTDRLVMRTVNTTA